MVSEHLQLSINQMRTAVESIIEFFKSKTKFYEVHEEFDVFIRLVLYAITELSDIINFYS